MERDRQCKVGHSAGIAAQLCRICCCCFYRLRLQSITDQKNMLVTKQTDVARADFGEEFKLSSSS